MKVKIHAFETNSRANGPGLRAVVWFQGCSLACSGCFNQETHDPNCGLEIDTEKLARKILDLDHHIDGVSISGGEPFQQADALLALLGRIKETNLSVLIFSGLTLEEIKNHPLGEQILQLTDVLIAGRYQKLKHQGHALLGSSNQKIHLLTNRYKLTDFESIPQSEAIIHRDGSITITGIHRMKAKFARNE